LFQSSFRSFFLSNKTKKRRLEAAVQAIQLKWGSQALRKGAPPAVASSFPALPTGLTALDRMLRGGLPLGHITEIIGQSTSGKRTLALHCVAQAQSRYSCVYVDLAQTFDPVYAAACHVDLAHLPIATPADPARALDLACDLANGGHFGLIVFDSTAELLSGSFPPGAAAATLRRLHHNLNGQPSALLFLTTPFFDEPGAPANYPFGFDLGQVAALRLLISRQRWLRQHGSIRGYEAQVSVLRSRWSAAGQQAAVRIAFNGVRVT
jgi:recombination protein RecA